MITPLLCLMLNASAPWVEVKANGFTFQMPAQPEIKNGPVTWPTTGQMIQTEWTSRLKTGDQQVDTLGCYESTVPSARMVGLMHDKHCKPDPAGSTQSDRTDPVTQARECLLLGPSPDGNRRTLVKILQVGDNVCVLSSSARLDGLSTEPTPSMRRFVDSLKLTGKPTVLSVTPWVALSTSGARFELPTAVEPVTTEVTDPQLGKHKATKWVATLGEETLSVTCHDVTSLKAKKAILSVCDKPKDVRTLLPSGATECAIAGPPTILMRVFSLPNQTCIAAATRQLGETTQDARRFVESFAKAK